MAFVIQTITAFIGEEDGEEGVWGFRDQKTGAWVPMVCADEKRVETLYPIALEIQEAIGKPFRVLQFSVRTDITDETKAKYEHSPTL